jgi:fatty-acyl-CoA synthase
VIGGSEAMSEFLQPHLKRGAANFQPLTPLEFLIRAVEVAPGALAMAWKGRGWTYREFGALVGRFAARLRGAGVARGDVVSVMLPNRPEMLAAHFAIPMLGAILNTINTRLDADTIENILRHSKSHLIVTDASFAAIASAAAGKAGTPVAIVEAPPAGIEAQVIDLFDPAGPALALGTEEVIDEWQPICVNYTSGTTGRPKGVVYHHRGAYLNSLGNVLALGLTQRSAYLWTLPMFHCNGWCHTWAVTAATASHVCLEKPDPALIFAALSEHAITHFACAPVVLYMLLNHPARPASVTSARIKVATGGAAPTATLIAQLDALGFDLTHLYGLTESFGPASLCAGDDGLALDAEGKAAYLARQGVRHLTASRLRVVDEAGADVPADATSLGEIVLKGNTLMAGYLGDAEATRAAFAGGMFHTGDVAVMHPDGFVEIKDRSKDVIISGGENISSLEVESVLHQHPAVLLAAVVAGPDAKWGEIPWAFVELKTGARVEPEELRRFCRSRLAGFKVPRRFAFRELPKTATGKIQKFALREVAKRETAG